MTSGKFKLKKITRLADITPTTVLPESDLCFQDDEAIYQFKHERVKKERKVKACPGYHVFAEENGSIILKETELRQRDLLVSMVNTKAIFNEAQVFFDKLAIYEQLGEPKARKILIYSQPGMGKCLGINTPILMYDGSIKAVQDIEVGDLLMGPDSSPRTVSSLARGREEMFRVIPTKGNEFIANRSHILSLRESGPDTLVNISIDDYLKLSPIKQNRLKFWRTGVDFESDCELAIDPYILGLWLGDGSSNKSEIASADQEIKGVVRQYFAGLGLHINEYAQNNGRVALRATSGTSIGGSGRNIFLNMLRSYSLLGNKHIPLVYKTASRSDRLKLLAGLVDSDGHLDMGCFDFCQKSSILADDIAYLARSLGYAVHRTVEQKSCTNSKELHIAHYHRVRISGELSEVPTRLARKKAEARKQVKNVLRTGFTVESIGDGEYYGFTIDRDRLFLLGDFTVTHNTASITQYCQMAIKEDPGTVVIVWPTSQIESEWVLDFLERKIEYTKKCTRVILIMEDIGGGERENQGESRGVDSALLDLLDGLRMVFKLPTFMIATTNYPQNLLSALADRPGRFDMMLELDPPSYEEKVQLVEFIAKRSLTEEEKDALSSKELKDFSVAHLKEIVVRSMIHDKTIPQVIKELVAHKKKFHDAFAKKAKDSMGFNL